MRLFFFFFALVALTLAKPQCKYGGNGRGFEQQQQQQQEGGGYDGGSSQMQQQQQQEIYDGVGGQHQEAYSISSAC